MRVGDNLFASKLEVCPFNGRPSRGEGATDGAKMQLQRSLLFAASKFWPLIILFKYTTNIILKSPLLLRTPIGPLLLRN